MADEATPTTTAASSTENTLPLIPGLPDDVAFQCIARVPRCHHPTASLVSKSWNSSLKSPRLYATRSHLTCTEQFLFVNLRRSSSFLWYHQYHGIRSALSPLPPIPSRSQPIGPAFVALGPKIYVIGGSVNDIPSNSVWIFDCRFNKWEAGPRMKVAREFAAAGAVDGKIYVIGGCVVDNWARSVNWAEVFDPSTGLWATIPSPIEVRDKWMHACAVIGCKVYAMADRGGVVYDVATAAWGSVPKRLDLGWRGRAAVVDGILYCYDYLGKIRGYDRLENVWKELQGMEKHLPKFLCGATMVNLCGRLCVVWERKGSAKEVEIMCAEIEVRKDGVDGLNGSVLWSGVILVVPDRSSSIVHCLAVAL